ncbi:hypothetical protein FACS1894125_0680 [Actinomycetota bacterium]|nr:hypothetical protein FACS1894125_0680 [Actinomycetota bacterium]
MSSNRHMTRDIRILGTRRLSVSFAVLISVFLAFSAYMITSSVIDWQAIADPDGGGVTVTDGSSGGTGGSGGATDGDGSTTGGDGGGALADGATDGGAADGSTTDGGASDGATDVGPATGAGMLGDDSGTGFSTMALTGEDGDGDGTGITPYAAGGTTTITNVRTARSAGASGNYWYYLTLSAPITGLTTDNFSVCQVNDVTSLATNANIGNCNDGNNYAAGPVRIQGLNGNENVGSCTGATVAGTCIFISLESQWGGTFASNALILFHAANSNASLAGMADTVTFGDQSGGLSANLSQPNAYPGLLVNGETATILPTLGGGGGPCTESPNVGPTINLITSPVTSAPLNVTWNKPTQTNCATVTGYTYVINPGNVFFAINGGDNTSYSMTETDARVDARLVPGNTYEISVRANSDSGEGAFSAPVTFTYQPAAVAAPTNWLTAATRSGNTVTVTFAQPVDTLVANEIAVCVTNSDGSAGWTANGNGTGSTGTNPTGLPLANFWGCSPARPAAKTDNQGSIPALSSGANNLNLEGTSTISAVAKVGNGTQWTFQYSAPAFGYNLQSIILSPASYNGEFLPNIERFFGGAGCAAGTPNGCLTADYFAYGFFNGGETAIIPPALVSGGGAPDADCPSPVANDNGGYVYCQNITVHNRLQNVLNPEDPTLHAQYDGKTGQASGTPTGGVGPNGTTLYSAADTKAWSLTDQLGYDGQGINTNCSAGANGNTIPRWDLLKSDTCYDKLSSFNISPSSFSNMRVEVASQSAANKGNGISTRELATVGTTSYTYKAADTGRSDERNVKAQSQVLGETYFDPSSGKFKVRNYDTTFAATAGLPTIGMTGSLTSNGNNRTGNLNKCTTTNKCNSDNNEFNNVPGAQVYYMLNRVDTTKPSRTMNADGTGYDTSNCRFLKGTPGLGGFGRDSVSAAYASANDFNDCTSNVGIVFPKLASDQEVLSYCSNGTFPCTGGGTNVAESFTVYYDNVGNYSTLKSPKSYKVSAKVVISQIKGYNGTVPRFQFASVFYDGFTYDNVNQFKVDVTFYHKYDPNDCISLTSATCKVSQERAGKPLNFEPAKWLDTSTTPATERLVDYPLRKSDANFEAKLVAVNNAVQLGAFSLNGHTKCNYIGNTMQGVGQSDTWATCSKGTTGEANAWGSNGGEKVAHYDNSGASLLDGVLASDANHNWTAAVEYGGTSTYTPDTADHRLFNQGAYQGFLAGSDGDPGDNWNWDQATGCNNKDYCWVDKLPGRDGRSNPSFANGGVSFPISGVESHFAFGAANRSVWASLTSGSTYPISQDLPTKTVSQHINNTHDEGAWSNATGIEYDYIDHDLDSCTNPAYLTKTTCESNGATWNVGTKRMTGYPNTASSKIPGYEHRNDNDLDRLWAIGPNVIKNPTGEDSFIPAQLAPFTWKTESEGLAIDKTSAKHYKMFSESDKPYCTINGAVNLEHQTAEECEADPNGEWRQGAVSSYDPVTAGDALAYNTSANVFNFSKSIVNNWLRASADGELNETTHSKNAIYEAGASTQDNTTKIYPDSHNRLLLQDYLDNGDKFRGCIQNPDTWPGLPVARQLGANDLVHGTDADLTKHATNSKSYQPTNPSNTTCTNASNRDTATRDQILNTTNNWPNQDDKQNDTTSFDYYINQALPSKSQTSLAPASIIIEDVLPQGVELDSSGFANNGNSVNNLRNAPIVIWDWTGKAICYWSDGGDAKLNDVDKCTNVVVANDVPIQAADVTDTSYGVPVGTAAGNRTRYTITLSITEIDRITGALPVDDYFDNYGQASTIKKELTVKIRGRMTEQAIRWSLGNPTLLWERSNSGKVTFNYPGYIEQYANISNVSNRVVVGAGTPPPELTRVLIDGLKIAGDTKAPLPGAKFTLVPSTAAGAPLSKTEYCKTFAIDTDDDLAYTIPTNRPCNSGNTGSVEDLAVFYPVATSLADGRLYFDRAENVCEPHNPSTSTSPMDCTHNSTAVGYLPGSKDSSTGGLKERYYVLTEADAPAGYAKTADKYILQLTTDPCTGKTDTGCILLSKVGSAAAPTEVSPLGLKAMTASAGAAVEFNFFSDVFTISDPRQYSLDLGKIISQVGSAGGVNLNPNSRIRWDHEWMPGKPTSPAPCLGAGATYDPNLRDLAPGTPTPNCGTNNTPDDTVQAKFTIYSLNAGAANETNASNWTSLGEYGNDGFSARTESLLDGGIVFEQGKTYYIAESQTPRGFDNGTAGFVLTWPAGDNAPTLKNATAFGVYGGTINKTTQTNIDSVNNTDYLSGQLAAWQTSGDYCANGVENKDAAAQGRCTGANNINTTITGYGTSDDPVSTLITGIGTGAVLPILHYNVRNSPKVESRIILKKQDPFANPLQDAIFALYKSNTNGQIIPAGTNCPTVDGFGVPTTAVQCNGVLRTSGATVNSLPMDPGIMQWSGLDQGFYVLKEWTSPSGYPNPGVNYVVEISDAGATVYKMLKADGTVATTINDVPDGTNGTPNYRYTANPQTINGVRVFDFKNNTSIILNEKKFQIDPTKRVTGSRNTLAGAVFVLLDCGQRTGTVTSGAKQGGQAKNDADCISQSSTTKLAQYVSDSAGKLFLDANNDGVHQASETVQLVARVLDASNTYILKETKFPNGYRIHQGYYKFEFNSSSNEITAQFYESTAVSGVALTTSDDASLCKADTCNSVYKFYPIENFSIFNEELKSTLEFVKRDAIGNPLKDATFTLTKVGSDCLSGCTTSKNPIGLNNVLTQVGNANGTPDLPGTPRRAVPTAKTTDTKYTATSAATTGQVSFNNLLDGYYLLEETDAPAGWEKSDRQYLIRIIENTNLDGSERSYSAFWDITGAATLGDISTMKPVLMPNADAPTHQLFTMDTISTQKNGWTPFVNRAVFDVNLIKYNSVYFDQTKASGAHTAPEFAVGAQFSLFECQGGSTTPGMTAVVTTVGGTPATSACDSPRAVMSNIQTDAQGRLDFKSAITGFKFDAQKAYLLVETQAPSMFKNPKGFYILGCHWLGTADTNASCIPFVTFYAGGEVAGGVISTTNPGTATLLGGQHVSGQGSDDITNDAYFDRECQLDTAAKATAQQLAGEGEWADYCGISKSGTLRDVAMLNTFIKDVPDPAQIQFTKYNNWGTGEDKKLGGAEFTAQKVTFTAADLGKLGTVAVSGTAATATPDGSSLQFTSCEGTETTGLCLTNGVVDATKKGKVFFDDLANGYYIIWENDPPKSYKASQNVYLVQITAGSTPNKIWKITSPAITATYLDTATPVLTSTSKDIPAAAITANNSANDDEGRYIYNLDNIGTWTADPVSAGPLSVDFTNPMMYAIDPFKNEQGMLTRTLAGMKINVYECSTVAVAGDDSGLTPGDCRAWLQTPIYAGLTTGADGHFDAAASNIPNVNYATDILLDVTKIYLFQEVDPPAEYLPVTQARLIITFNLTTFEPEVRYYNATSLGLPADGSSIQELRAATGGDYSPLFFWSWNTTGDYPFAEFNVSDRPIPARFSFNKLDKLGYIAPGAIFQLEEVSGKTPFACPSSSTFADGTTATCVNVTNPLTSVTTSMTAKVQMTSDATGKVQLPAGVVLGDGKYVLSEVKAPTGYTATDVQYYIDLDRTWVDSTGLTSRKDSICVYDSEEANKCLINATPTDLAPKRSLTGSGLSQVHEIDVSDLVDLANAKNYQVVLDKVDKTTPNWHLQGAKYQLYEIADYNRGDQGSNDGPSTNGSWSTKTQVGNDMTTDVNGHIEALEDYKFSTDKDYMLIETVAPDGHKIDTAHPTYYIITWHKDGTVNQADAGNAVLWKYVWVAGNTNAYRATSTLDSSNNTTFNWFEASNTVTITNERVLNNLSLMKYDDELTPQGLGGAQFKLTEVNYTAAAQPQNPGTVTAKAGVTSKTTTSCDGTTTPADDDACDTQRGAGVTTAAKGTVNFWDLPDGTYIIEETVQPTFFNKSPNKYLVTFTSSASPVLYVYPLNSTTCSTESSTSPNTGCNPTGAGTAINRSSTAITGAINGEIPQADSWNNYAIGLSAPVNFVNEKQFHIDLTKKDYDTKTVLPGATFTLSRCATSSSNCQTLDTSAGSSGIVFTGTTDATGRITSPNLSAFNLYAKYEYRLDETAAPTGRQKASGYWIISYNYTADSVTLRHFDAAGNLADLGDGNGSTMDGIGAHSITTTTTASNLRMVTFDLYNYEPKISIDITKYSRELKRLADDGSTTNPTAVISTAQTPQWGAMGTEDTLQNGVQFSIYRANTGTGSIIGNALDSDTTGQGGNATGVATFKDLKYSTETTYRIAETTTPAGYLANNDEYIVQISYAANASNPVIKIWKTTKGATVQLTGAGAVTPNKTINDLTPTTEAGTHRRLYNVTSARSDINYYNNKLFRVDLDKVAATDRTSALSGAKFAVYECSAYYVQSNISTELATRGYSTVINDATAHLNSLANDTGYASANQGKVWYGAVPGNAGSCASGTGTLVAKGVSDANHQLNNDTTIDGLPNMKNYEFNQTKSYYLVEETAPSGFLKRNNLRLSFMYFGGSFFAGQTSTADSGIGWRPLYSAYIPLVSDYTTCTKVGGSDNGTPFDCDTQESNGATANKIQIYNISQDVDINLTWTKYIAETTTPQENAKFRVTTAEPTGAKLDSTATNYGEWEATSDSTGKVLVNKYSAISASAKNLSSGYYLIEEIEPPTGGYIPADNLPLLVHVAVQTCEQANITTTGGGPCDTSSGSIANIALVDGHVWAVIQDSAGNVKNLEEIYSFGADQTNSPDVTLSGTIATVEVYSTTVKHSSSTYNNGYVGDNKGYYVDLTKIDSKDGNRKLENATFALYECARSDFAALTPIGSGKKCQGTTYPNIYTANADYRYIDNFTTNSDGYSAYLSTHPLDVTKVYKLVEIAAPNGYNVSNTEFTIYYDLSATTAHVVAFDGTNYTSHTSTYSKGSAENETTPVAGADGACYATTNAANTLGLGCLRFDVDDPQVWTITFEKLDNVTAEKLTGAEFVLCRQIKQKYLGDELTGFSYYANQLVDDQAESWRYRPFNDSQFGTPDAFTNSMIEDVINNPDGSTTIIEARQCLAQDGAITSDPDLAKRFVSGDTDGDGVISPAEQAANTGIVSITDIPQDLGEYWVMNEVKATPSYLAPSPLAIDGMGLSRYLFHLSLDNDSSTTYAIGNAAKDVTKDKINGGFDNGDKFTWYQKAYCDARGCPVGPVMPLNVTLAATPGSQYVADIASSIDGNGDARGVNNVHGFTVAPHKVDDITGAPISGARFVLRDCGVAFERLNHDTSQPDADCVNNNTPKFDSNGFQQAGGVVLGEFESDASNFGHLKLVAGAIGFNCVYGTGSAIYDMEGTCKDEGSYLDTFSLSSSRKYFLTEESLNHCLLNGIKLTYANQADCESAYTTKDDPTDTINPAGSKNQIPDVYGVWVPAPNPSPNGYASLVDKVGYKITYNYDNNVCNPIKT